MRYSVLTYDNFNASHTHAFRISINDNTKKYNILNAHLQYLTDIKWFCEPIIQDKHIWSIKNKNFSGECGYGSNYYQLSYVKYFRNILMSYLSELLCTSIILYGL